MSSYSRFISEGNEPIVQTEYHSVKHDIQSPALKRMEECFEKTPIPVILTQVNGFQNLHEYLMRITVAY
jgi:hypothetical protein